MIRPRKCLRAEARLLDILLEPWEGYRSPPVPEGTDATQIPVLKSASEWRDYDPSLHYVNGPPRFPVCGLLCRTWYNVP